MGLVDGSGSTVVEYRYDAWGKLLSTTGALASTLGNDNPIRYRGYYYDAETGLYYLQSRYYDPDTGRFINSDDAAFLGATGTALSCNLFAYCENNPINRSDPSGYAFRIARTIVALVIDIAIMAILPFVVTAHNAVKLASWARFINGFEKIFKNAATKLAKLIMKSINKILKLILKTGANAATLAFTTSKLTGIIMNIFSLSIGGVIAFIIDVFDKDGKSGYIVL